MTSTRLSLIVMLLALVNGARSENACGGVQTSHVVVALGSPVSATCVIKKSCPIPIPANVQIEWRLDENVFPSSTVANQSGTFSEVVIPSFNSSKAVLTCRVLTSPPQIVDGVYIRAGSLPSVPHQIHCLTNLTTPSTMTCTWDPGRDSLLPTNYSLYTHIRDSSNHSYDLPTGQHSYTISHSDFRLFTEMDIYVKAVNELGETKSEPVIVEPLSVAKYDPPQIRSIRAAPTRYGCLTMDWKLSPRDSWMKNHPFGVQVMVADSEQWRDQHNFEKTVQPETPIDQCRLLHGTRYTVQMRVRYKQSPWSEWSRGHSGVTLETAPTGRLDSWMEVSGDRTHKQLSVHLFWKPSKQFRANGQNVSYVVSRTKQPGVRGQLCTTAERHCTFQAPAGAKVFLSAVNAAGISNPTEMHIYCNKNSTAITEMTVTPYDDTSLLVKWKSVASSSLLGFIVVWRPLLRTDPAYVQFESTNKTQNSFIISGSIEPYKPYGIAVYPRFKVRIGLPQTDDAFSRQKAPLIVPNLRIEKSQHLNTELIWDEIPLDQRNGVIQGYKVFYWEKNGSVHVMHAKPDERRIFLKNLKPRTMYEVFLMVSTFGGSRNGSVIHFQTGSFDMISIVITVTCTMALVLAFLVIVYTSYDKRFKRRFWPIIPDPANSSIKEWSTESLEEFFPGFSSKEPSLVYLSHISFLDLPAKIKKEEDDHWLNSAEDTSDLGESICGSPTIPGYCGSNSSSVPYTTVVFSTSPCTSPGPRENHAYLRSESTRPLLEEEEAFTPMCYQNVLAEKTSEPRFFGSSDSHGVEEVPEPNVEWDEFPFLSALAMNDSEND